jgi:hypothetical protein
MSADVPPTGTKMAPQLYPVALVAWLWVLLPFSWGLYKLLEKVNDLFG